MKRGQRNLEEDLDREDGITAHAWPLCSCKDLSCWDRAVDQELQLDRAFEQIVQIRREEDDPRVPADPL